MIKFYQDVVDNKMRIPDKNSQSKKIDIETGGDSPEPDNSLEQINEENMSVATSNQLGLPNTQRINKKESTMSLLSQSKPLKKIQRGTSKLKLT